MERKVYSDNFERFLKGHADQFKMTPSKKVWHGIYNDLHPGRRWPSAAMSMVIIFTLVIVGHLNTNNGYKQDFKTTSLQDKTNEVKQEVTKTDRITHNNFIQQYTAPKQSEQSQKDQPQVLSDQPLSDRITTQEQWITSSSEHLKTEPSLNVSPQEKLQLPVKQLITPGTDIKTSDNEKASAVLNSTKQVENPKQVEKTEVIISNPEQESEIIKNIPLIPIHAMQETSVKEKTAITPNANANNISKPGKLTSITLGYYFTPSMGYRFFSSSDMNHSVKHRMNLNYEAGTSINAAFSDKFKVTTGLQLNYSGYNIKATNVHPIVASILMNSQSPGQFSVYSGITHYGNSVGNDNTTLKNYSLQLSLPVGVQYTFGGNDNISFGLGAAFQPTYILKGKSYLLSDDAKNYLNASDLLRKWNFNTNVSTFIAFSSSTLKWQIGPQVRYQFLSTYSSLYPARENLVNYGLRIGISRNSR